MHSMGNIGYMRTISRGRMRGTDFVGGVRTINCVTPIATNVVKLLDVSPFTRRRDEQVAKKTVDIGNLVSSWSSTVYIEVEDRFKIFHLGKDMCAVALINTLLASLQSSDPYSLVLAVIAIFILG